MDMPTDPREMRKRINATVRGDLNLDGSYASAHHYPAGSIVRNADNTAHYMGWSGEDRMTLIAYLALDAYERMYKIAFDQVMLQPSPLFVTPASPPAPTPEG